MMLGRVGHHKFVPVPVVKDKKTANLRTEVIALEKQLAEALTLERREREELDAAKDRLQYKKNQQEEVILRETAMLRSAKHEFERCNTAKKILEQENQKIDTGLLDIRRLHLEENLGSFNRSKDDAINIDGGEEISYKTTLEKMFGWYRQIYGSMDSKYPEDVKSFQQSPRVPGLKMSSLRKPGDLAMRNLHSDDYHGDLHRSAHRSEEAHRSGDAEHHAHRSEESYYHGGRGPHQTDDYPVDHPQVPVDRIMSSESEGLRDHGKHVGIMPDNLPSGGVLPGGFPGPQAGSHGEPGSHGGVHRDAEIDVSAESQTGEGVAVSQGFHTVGGLAEVLHLLKGFHQSLFESEEFVKTMSLNITLISNLDGLLEYAYKEDYPHYAKFVEDIRKELNRKAERPTDYRDIPNYERVDPISYYHHYNDADRPRIPPTEQSRSIYLTSEILREYDETSTLTVKPVKFNCDDPEPVAGQPVEGHLLGFKQEHVPKNHRNSSHSWKQSHERDPSHTWKPSNQRDLSADQNLSKNRRKQTQQRDKVGDSWQPSNHSGSSRPSDLRLPNASKNSPSKVRDAPPTENANNVSSDRPMLSPERKPSVSRIPVGREMSQRSRFSPGKNASVSPNRRGNSSPNKQGSSSPNKQRSLSPKRPPVCTKSRISLVAHYHALKEKGLLEANNMLVGQGILSGHRMRTSHRLGASHRLAGQTRPGVQRLGVQTQHRLDRLGPPNPALVQMKNSDRAGTNNYTGIDNPHSTRKGATRGSIIQLGNLKHDADKIENIVDKYHRMREHDRQWREMHQHEGQECVTKEYDTQGHDTKEHDTKEHDTKEHDRQKQDRKEQERKSFDPPTREVATREEKLPQKLSKPIREFGMDSKLSDSATSSIVMNSDRLGPPGRISRISSRNGSKNVSQNASKSVSQFASKNPSRTASRTGSKEHASGDGVHNLDSAEIRDSMMDEFPQCIEEFPHDTTQRQHLPPPPRPIVPSVNTIVGFSSPRPPDSKHLLHCSKGATCSKDSLSDMGIVGLSASMGGNTGAFMGGNLATKTEVATATAGSLGKIGNLDVDQNFGGIVMKSNKAGLTPGNVKAVGGTSERLAGEMVVGKIANTRITQKLTLPSTKAVSPGEKMNSRRRVADAKVAASPDEKINSPGPVKNMSRPTSPVKKKNPSPRRS